MTTMREHLVHLRSVHHADNAGECIWCKTAWPCAHKERLDAALAILDAANRVTVRSAANWSPMNEFGQSVITAGPLIDLGVRLVPDPEATA